MIHNITKLEKILIKTNPDLYLYFNTDENLNFTQSGKEENFIHIVSLKIDLYNIKFRNRNNQKFYINAVDGNKNLVEFPNSFIENNLNLSLYKENKPEIIKQLTLIFKSDNLFSDTSKDLMKNFICIFKDSSKTEQNSSKTEQNSSTTKQNSSKTEQNSSTTKQNSSKTEQNSSTTKQNSSTTKQNSSTTKQNSSKTKQNDLIPSLHNLNNNIIIITYKDRIQQNKITFLLLFIILILFIFYIIVL